MLAVSIVSNVHTMVVLHRVTEDVLRRSSPRQREERGLVEVTGVIGKRAEAMASELGGRKCAHCPRLIFHAKLEEQPTKCALCRRKANAARTAARAAKNENRRSDDPAAAIYNQLKKQREFEEAVKVAYKVVKEPEFESFLGYAFHQLTGYRPKAKGERQSQTMDVSDDDDEGEREVCAHMTLSHRPPFTSLTHA